MVILKTRSFTGCGKSRFQVVLYQGTPSGGPLSRLFLIRRADFSPRGVCVSQFFSSLFRCAFRLLFCHHAAAAARGFDSLPACYGTENSFHPPGA